MMHLASVLLALTAAWETQLEFKPVPFRRLAKCADSANDLEAGWADAANTANAKADHCDGDDCENSDHAGFCTDMKAAIKSAYGILQGGKAPKWKSKTEYENDAALTDDTTKTWKAAMKSMADCDEDPTTDYPDALKYAELFGKYCCKSCNAINADIKDEFDATTTKAPAANNSSGSAVLTFLPALVVAMLLAQ